mgnify:CR=1 FL=1|jgi:hypothetical protein
MAKGHSALLRAGTELPILDNNSAAVATIRKPKLHPSETHDQLPLCKQCREVHIRFWSSCVDKPVDLGSTTV